MPYTTLIHSAPLMASKLPCSAMAAPVRPAISEWLWLVGMPKYQATVPHTMMAHHGGHESDERLLGVASEIGPY